jgi:hypothetical protein
MKFRNRNRSFRQKREKLREKGLKKSKIKRKKMPEIEKLHKKLKLSLKLRNRKT